MSMPSQACCVTSSPIRAPLIMHPPSRHHSSPHFPSYFPSQVLAVSPCPGHLLSLATEYPPGPDATAVAWLPALSAPTVAVCCGTRVHLYALTCDARLEYLGGVEMPGGARVLAAGGCGVVVGACRDGVVAAQVRVGCGVSENG